MYDWPNQRYILLSKSPEESLRLLKALSANKMSAISSHIKISGIERRVTQNDAMAATTEEADINTHDIAHAIAQFWAPGLVEDDDHSFYEIKTLYAAMFDAIAALIQSEETTEAEEAEAGPQLIFAQAYADPNNLNTDAINLFDQLRRHILNKILKLERAVWTDTASATSPLSNSNIIKIYHFFKQLTYLLSDKDYQTFMAARNNAHYLLDQLLIHVCAEDMAVETLTHGPIAQQLAAIIHTTLSKIQQEPKSFPSDTTIFINYDFIMAMRRIINRGSSAKSASETVSHTLSVFQCLYPIINDFERIKHFNIYTQDFWILCGSGGLIRTLQDRIREFAGIANNMIPDNPIRRVRYDFAASLSDPIYANLCRLNKLFSPAIMQIAFKFFAYNFNALNVPLEKCVTEDFYHFAELLKLAETINLTADGWENPPLIVILRDFSYAGETYNNTAKILNNHAETKSVFQALCFIDALYVYIRAFCAEQSKTEHLHAYRFIGSKSTSHLTSTYAMLETTYHDILQQHSEKLGLDETKQLQKHFIAKHDRRFFKVGDTDIQSTLTRLVDEKTQQLEALTNTCKLHSING